MSPLRTAIIRTVLSSAAFLSTGVLITRTATAGPELDGATVYQDNCGRCHMPRTPSDLSSGGWRAVTFHMRVTVNLSKAEFDALEAFLAPPPATPEPGTTSRPVESNPVLAGNCLRCHDSQRIQDAVDGGRTMADWTTTLNRMRTYGAQITPEQADELARWLATEAPSSR